MSYNIKNLFGSCLETVGIVEIAGMIAVAGYDASFSVKAGVIGAMGALTYCIGRELRNKALEEKIELKKRKELTDKL